MEQSCVEEGMKLGRQLLVLGMRASGAANASYEDYQALAKRAGEALAEVESFQCLSKDEKAVMTKEISYLQKSAGETHFLFTSDAGSRLLQLLHNPQFYVRYYGEKEPFGRATIVPGLEVKED